MPLDQDPVAAAFTQLMRLIPLKQRLEHSAEIKLLCKHHKLDDSLLHDQRSRPGFGDHWAQKRRDMNRYWVEVRGEESCLPMSLIEAAAYMRVTPNSIRQRVTSKKKWSRIMDLMENGKFTGLTDLVTVSKMTDEELAEETKQFYAASRSTPPHDA